MSLTSKTDYQIKQYDCWVILGYFMLFSGFIVLGSIMLFSGSLLFYYMLDYLKLFYVVFQIIYWVVFFLYILKGKYPFFVFVL